MDWNCWYSLDENHNPVKVASLEEMVTWQITKPDERRVSLTELEDGTKISTVFLMLAHGLEDGKPILFETMIFGGPNNDYQRRYTSWEEAKAGHEIAVLLAKSSEEIKETVESSN